MLTHAGLFSAQAEIIPCAAGQLFSAQAEIIPCTNGTASATDALLRSGGDNSIGRSTA